MRVENVRARDYTRGRPGRPTHIVIHHWGVDGQKHDNVVSWFRNGNSRQTSAHYVVSAGRVTRMVPLGDTAHHCAGFNSKSIGIECRPEASGGDIEAAVWAIREVRANYGDLPLIGHRDRRNTSCPGRYYLKLGQLDRMARGNVTVEDITDMGYQIVYFTNGGNAYEADVVGGTYRRIANPATLDDRQWIVSAAKIKSAWLGDLRGTGDSELKNIWCMGRDVSV